MRRRLSEDVYVVLAAYDMSDQSATFQVTVNPLVNWIWFGFALLALGTGIALLPESRFAFLASKAPGAEVGAASGATTTDACRTGTGDARSGARRRQRQTPDDSGSREAGSCRRRVAGAPRESVARRRKRTTMTADRLDLPQGTLELLILKTLALEPRHGWGISERIRQVSRDVLEVRQGSLYPALHRLGAAGLDCRVVGHVRAQPAGQVLRVDAEGTPPAPIRRRCVARAHDGSGPRARRRLGTCAAERSEAK